jgi:hypothetical protein
MAIQNIGDAMPVAFLETNKLYADGEAIGGEYAFYTGHYRYKSTFGVKTVYAFKLFDFKHQYLDGRQYYFYPRMINVDGVDMDKAIKNYYKVSSKKRKQI